jgi:DNA-binding response OmpR family regulator
MLTMLGYHTLQAATSAEALNIVRSGMPIDLLITDVGLPGGMNGRHLADAVQKERGHLKTLFITGYSEDVATRSGMLEPGMGIITKSFAMDVFAARVHGMLEGASPRQHARLS